MSVKQFEILEMIAKGGMAEVFRAKTSGVQGFEKEVCVKKILPHLTEDESFVEMFINEAKLAATLNYANIVHVHDLCRSAAGEFFIVMEYVAGKDLSDVIRAAQLAGREVPIDMAVYFGRETLKGLHYAHTKTDPEGASLHIIHRDISPHNVLVSYMGEVKITDFGIAKASSIMNKTAVGILKGKYGYMSPEQARGQPLDARSDLFNTGIVMYELLVGERCFAGSSDFSTLNLMRNAEVTPPTKINTRLPKELEAIVLKALSKERGDRYQDAMEFERALGQFAKSHGVLATASEASEFMKGLFSGSEDKKSNGVTGVLDLASIAGPAASGHSKDVKKSAPEAHKAEAPAAAEAPPKDAKEAKKRAAREAAQRAKAEAGGISHKEAAPEKPAPAPAPAPEKANPPALAPAPAPEMADGRDATKAIAVKEVEAKAEKKPAKIKADKPADDAKEAKEPGKKKGKAAASDTPKKPVGRKDLRPGLTRVQQIQSGLRPRTLMKAVALIAISLVGGAAIGRYRASQVQSHSSFRDLELGGADTGGGRKTVSILIETEPPGATVRFDSLELSERTPVLIDRDRDLGAHNLVLTMEGYKSAARSLRYASGTITTFKERLEGDPGKLEVESEPSGLPVKIDGEEAGLTPLFKNVAAGKRIVEIGGGDRMLVRVEVDVAVGKSSNVHRVVPDKEAMAGVSIRSVPRARIYLDGKPTEHWTNDGEMPLPPGISHKIGLRLDPRKDRQQLTLTLKKGERRALFFDLGESS